MKVSQYSTYSTKKIVNNLVPLLCWMWCYQNDVKNGVLHHSDSLALELYIQIIPHKLTSSNLQVKSHPYTSLMLAQLAYSYYILEPLSCRAYRENHVFHK